MPSISIIIPALNEAEGIGRAVGRAWALGPAELLVVDGGSDDATAQRAREAGAHVLLSPRGRGRQQNAGASCARGEILLFLHADSWLEPGGLDQLLCALDRGARVGGFRQRIDDPRRAFRWLELGNLVRGLRNGQLYGDQGIFIERALFDELGGFPETSLLEDVALMRAVRRVAPITILPGPLHVSARRWHRQGIVRQTLRNWTILAAHRAGVSPETLAGYYQGRPKS